MERGGASGAGGPTGGETSAAVVDAPRRERGPKLFLGSFEHSVDDKNRLVLPAVYRPRLAAGAYIAPLDGFVGLWPEDGFEAVLDKYDDGVDLGIVSPEARDAFEAASFPVQPDSQGRIAVPRSLREFGGLAGPVMVVGARHRLGVWARDRWERRQETIPGGADDALRQAARDLKL